MFTRIDGVVTLGMEFEMLFVYRSLAAVEGRDTLTAENQELRSRIAEVEGQMKDVLRQKEQYMESKQQEMQNNAVKLK